MANRNDSDARQHETLPGPGPGPSAPTGGSVRPVEQMVDAAIERIARERSGFERAGGRGNGGNGNAAPIELARRSSGEANLARRDSQLPARVPTRLRWKGLEVSEEFRQYAERVARGEELPPFEGRVLAEPNPAFPWGDATVATPEPKKRASHPLLWGAAILVLGALGWSVALKLEGAGAHDPLETTFAATPLAAAPMEGQPGAADVTPPDVVETPAPVASSEPEPKPALAQPASAALPRPLPAPAPEAKVAAAAPAPNPPPAASPSVAVDLARPGALEEAVGAALARNGAAAPPAAASGGAASGKPVREDEFGIMASVRTEPVPAPPAAPPPAAPSPAAPPPAAPSPAAPSPAPPAAAGAKSNGNVGDMARAGQPSGSGVRKEPGSESSAKGSLLVETPSF